MPKDRFDLENADQTMWAVVTTGNEGYKKLVYRQVPRPVPTAGEVLLQVLAAGITTEINTRVGWYSASVTSSTAEGVEAQSGKASEKPAKNQMAAGMMPRPFPLFREQTAAAALLQ